MPSFIHMTLVTQKQPFPVFCLPILPDFFVTRQCQYPLSPLSSHSRIILNIIGMYLSLSYLLYETFTKPHTPKKLGQWRTSLYSKCWTMCCVYEALHQSLWRDAPVNDWLIGESYIVTDFICSVPGNYWSGPYVPDCFKCCK